jgi:hypothetical protein
MAEQVTQPNSPNRKAAAKQACIVKYPRTPKDLLGPVKMGLKKNLRKKGLEEDSRNFRNEPRTIEAGQALPTAPILPM